MLRSPLPALPLALAALLTGCGSGPDAACDFRLAAAGGMTSVHACLELSNLSRAQIDEANASCPSQGGEIMGKVVDACSTDDVLGFCTLSQQGIDAVEYFYVTPGVTAALAQGACEQAKGTWTTK